MYSLHFLRAGGVVEDTGCLIGDLIEVVLVADNGDVEAAAAVAGAAPAAAEQRQAGKQSGNSDSDRHKAPEAQGAEAAPVGAASSAPTERGAEAAENPSNGREASEGYRRPVCRAPAADYASEQTRAIAGCRRYECIRESADQSRWHPRGSEDAMASQRMQ